MGRYRSPETDPFEDLRPINYINENFASSFDVVFDTHRTVELTYEGAFAERRCRVIMIILLLFIGNG